MAAAALRAQLNAHIAGMYTDVRPFPSPLVVWLWILAAAEVARFFINNAYQILDDIRALMSVPRPCPPSALDLNEQPAVHFDEVEALVQQLMECTVSVGAQQVNLACRHFHHFNARKCEHGTVPQHASLKLK
ncbi:histidine-containing phosphotransfer protein 2-like [Triticum urartu]|uniref:histidine-containing phosphotransfer protein 2-like n=1 Tax=Triticum urartu TaxID=4572 RepID=UPI0020432469|nr:histidine-containing phosphotransfer protein 2-like [Triticum urartu]